MSKKSSPPAAYGSEAYWKSRKRDHISSLRLSALGFRELKKCGFETVGQIVAYSVSDLHKLLGEYGPEVLAELEEKELKFGMQIKGVSTSLKSPEAPVKEVKEKRSTYPHVETRTLQKVIHSYHAQLSNCIPEVAACISPPATDEEINELAGIFDIDLPEELIMLLKCVNGCNSHYFPFQYQLLSVKEICDTHRIFSEALEKGNLSIQVVNPDEVPEGVRSVSYDSHWIPFANIDRDTLYIDMNPGKTGQEGQIITSDGHFVKWLSKSLTQFMGQVDAGFASEWYYVDKDWGDIRSKGLAWFQSLEDKNDDWVIVE